jgi:hypothetical protein
MYKEQKDVYSIWLAHPSLYKGGVGIMLTEHLAKHIQKVYKFKGRIIAVDLYFSSFCLTIIVVYFLVNETKWAQERHETLKELNRLIHVASQRNAACIVMGDMNIDPDKYHSSTRSSPNLTLLRMFEAKGFRESSITCRDQPLPTYYNTDLNHHSRIDQIWHSPHFPLDSDLLHKELIDVNEHGISTDHFLLIHHYALERARKTLSQARLRQKGERRSILLYKKATIEQWDLYKQRVEEKLTSYV